MDSRRIPILLLCAVLAVLLAAPPLFACGRRCLAGVDYVLCADGRMMLDCEVVANCNPGCEPYDPACCSYYCAGQFCFRI